MKNRSNSAVVAEYRYNGLGFRTGWHSDVTDDGTTGEPDGEVDGHDPWFWFCYDESWRVVAVFRDEDDHPKEVYVHHNAGLDGYGGSSYIDAVVLRDRDANTAWADEADGTLEERVYYCQNWRADVVALFSSAGHMLQQVRYDPYGVPFGISKADLTADGVLDSADSSLFVALYNSGSGTHPFADWNLDGTLNSQDPIAYLNSYNVDVALGYGVLGYGFTRAGGANRKAYAGYEIDPVLTGANGRESVYHVRHRVLLSELGRWNRRDPLGYVDEVNLYGYSAGTPVTSVDPLGLVACPGGACFDTPKEECCQAARRHYASRGLPDAVLICCDGQQMICIFKDQLKLDRKTGQAAKVILFCTGVHECRHKLDSCDGLLKQCPPTDGFTPIDYPNTEDRKPLECSEVCAYEEEVLCLAQNMKECDKESDAGARMRCRKEIGKRLQDAERRRQEFLNKCPDPNCTDRRPNPGLGIPPSTDDPDSWCKCP